MNESENKPENTGIKQANRNPDGTFKDGFSGNPAGKPPGTKHMATRLNEMLLEAIPGDDKGRTYKEMFLTSLLSNAIKKANPHLMGLVLDHIDGKPNQGINMNVSGGLAQGEEHVMEIAKRVSEELKKEKTE